MTEQELRSKTRELMERNGWETNIHPNSTILSFYIPEEDKPHGWGYRFCDLPTAKKMYLDREIAKAEAKELVLTQIGSQAGMLTERGVRYKDRRLAEARQELKQLKEGYETTRI